MLGLSTLSAESGSQSPPSACGISPSGGRVRNPLQHSRARSPQRPRTPPHPPLLIIAAIGLMIARRPTRRADRGPAESRSPLPPDLCPRDLRGGRCRRRDRGGPPSSSPTTQREGPPLPAASARGLPCRGNPCGCPSERSDRGQPGTGNHKGCPYRNGRRDALIRCSPRHPLSPRSPVPLSPRVARGEMPQAEGGRPDSADHSVWSAAPRVARGEMPQAEGGLRQPRAGEGPPSVTP